jgi:predicted glycoside hydrolase/deacetylase ChbG (UPF0249 family)
LSPRALQIGVLNRVGRAARRRLGSGVRATDRTVGVVAAGGLTVEKLTRILEDVEGLTELVCHPGLGDQTLETAYGWGYGWDRETAALCDPKVRTAMEARGITLTSFSRA